MIFANFFSQIMLILVKIGLKIFSSDTIEPIQPKLV